MVVTIFKFILAFAWGVISSFLYGAGIEMDFNETDSSILGFVGSVLSISATGLALPQITKNLKANYTMISTAIKNYPYRAMILIQVLALFGFAATKAGIFENVVNVIMQAFKVIAVGITVVKLISAFSGGVGNVIWELGGYLISKIFLIPSISMLIKSMTQGGCRLTLRNFVHFSVS